jgi:hypothetical protein
MATVSRRDIGRSAATPDEFSTGKTRRSPVMQPTRFRFTINLKLPKPSVWTRIPPTLILADEVVE